MSYFLPGSSGSSAIHTSMASKLSATRGRLSACTSMSPRDTSISSSRVRVTAWPGIACSSSPSKVTMERTLLVLPDGSTAISSPLCTMPLARVPAKPRKFRFGRLTYCTGKRMSVRLRSAAISTLSRISISVGP
ncbi:hypothetical protein D3C75_784010 [compost metagenome]